MTQASGSSSRDPNLVPATEPVFGIVDEASKLNLNTASLTMLENLPHMTPDLAAAIIAWRTPGRAGGNASNTYAALTPPRLNKGASFESVDELRLVSGATLDLLFGEDTNRNGALDANEDDGDQSAPHDSQDGQLQPGILEYVTVYSAQPNTRADGSRRLDISTAQSRIQLRALLLRRLSSERTAAILTRLGVITLRSVAEFLTVSGMTADEFALIHTDITATAAGATVPGLVNVNTASATVLACLLRHHAGHRRPDRGLSAGPSHGTHHLCLAAAGDRRHRLSPHRPLHHGPVLSILGRCGRRGKAQRAGGYCREKVVFGTWAKVPRAFYWPSGSHLLWLGLGCNRTAETLKLAQNTNPTS